MGEANLRFVRGDRDTAIRMCMEIIRQDPTAPEPFQTLSNLYEEAGESEKSLQFALIAAHLSQPQDPEEWARLADVALELGDKQQAAACYKKGWLRSSARSSTANHFSRLFLSNCFGCGQRSLSLGSMYAAGGAGRKNSSASRISTVASRY
jgi:predicted Zn-dependent protease